MFHGDVQVHDLAAQGGVADEDWFAILSRPFSSYEVLVSGLQGELWGLEPTPPVDRVIATGAVLTAGDTAARRAGRLAVRALGQQHRDAGDGLHPCRRRPATCAVTCTADAQYTIRMWETTGAISRFNNSGSQSHDADPAEPDGLHDRRDRVLLGRRGDAGRRPSPSPAAEGGSP